MRRRQQREPGGREERRADKMRRAAKLRAENRRARGPAKKAARTGRGEEEPATREPATTQQNPKQKTVRVPPARLTRWKTLPQTTRDFIADAIDRALLSSLPRTDSDQEASLQLLRQLERRLLDRCSSLLVPPGKLKDLKDCRRLLVLEEAQLKEGEAALQNLQEELDRTLDRLERNRDEAEVLQEEIGQLRGFLEEAEDQGMQDRAPGVLNLPPLPPESFQQPTLQDQLMSVKNPRQILSELHALQRSSHVQMLSGFLEQAHAAAELLSFPGC
ncbi:centromere protein Q-like [Hypanus sabinus]|uniref:centromere protein Q-like n=1 Tax=Hypanus sabinus TaxID=79690 RepID=UPI0028C3E448|nr:centromere protein Q-like [Hypanus sabinus]